MALGIAKKYPDLISLKNFTKETYFRASYCVMSRCFGWAVPNIMLVPMADNCNHHCVENSFELFNSRLAKRMLAKDLNFSKHEQEYFTTNKMRVNFLKHFSEDDEVSQSQ